MDAPGPEHDAKLRVTTELKAGLRWSEDERFPLAFPFPPEFVPVGEPNVALQTVAPGTSIEVDKATVFLDASLPRGIAAHVVDMVEVFGRHQPCCQLNR